MVLKIGTARLVPVKSWAVAEEAALGLVEDRRTIGVRAKPLKNNNGNEPKVVVVVEKKMRTAGGQPEELVREEENVGELVRPAGAVRERQKAIERVRLLRKVVDALNDHIDLGRMKEVAPRASRKSGVIIRIGGPGMMVLIRCRNGNFLLSFPREPSILK